MTKCDTCNGTGWMGDLVSKTHGEPARTICAIECEDCEGSGEAPPAPLAADGHKMRLVRGADAIKAHEAGAPLYVLNPQKGWIPAGPGALERMKRSLALSTERGEGTHGLHIYGADLNDWTPFETEREKRGQGRRLSA